MIAGLRSAGELGRIDLLPGIALNYEHTSSEVRCWALWSGGLLGDEKAAADLPQLLSRPAIHPIVRGLISRILDYRGAVAIIDNLASCPTTARWAAIAIGHAGYADLIPLAISLMHLEPVARVAGEAVYAITGIDLSHERMEKEPASDFSAGPTEHADDANVALDPDENLPWPDKTQIEYWWKEHSGQFSQGVRYLLGRPMTENWLQTVLQDGRQRQRSGSALELAIRRRGKPLFNVSAPGFRQQRLIALGS
jgi:uncharacterized protein (TIGR02270 family)